MPTTPKSPPTKKSISSSSSGKSNTTAANNNNNNNNNTAAGEYLLERLRILLQRLQSTSEILQNWPETQGDSAKVHADTASQLIASIRKVVLGLRAVERHVNGTTGGSSNKDGTTAASDGSGSGSMSKEALEAFRSSLEDKCPIPLDLLDLLDVVMTQHPFGMNPQCYARGLMKEAMRQLAGLERRKRALAMLAQSIEIGMDDAARKQVQAVAGEVGGGENGEVEEESSDQKRKRYDFDEGESVKKVQRTN